MKQNNIAEKHEIDISTQKGNIKISFTDEENPSFRMEGPKELISSAIGGLGEEDDTRAWVTEKELDSEAKRLYAIIKVFEIVHKK